MLKRPTNIDDVVARMKKFRSNEAAELCKNFKATSDDVFISTYSKSGTTWMQQIVHQLKSGGDTDFSEISEVIPWLESAYDMGIDPNAEQTGGFRAFKCHLLFDDLPQNARYISVVRDPAKVLISFYRFFEGWWFEPGSVTLEEFANEFYFKGSAAGRHWDHLINWHQRSTEDDTLLLCYEDMLLAPEKVPGIVADFLDLKISSSTMALVIAHSSRDYMVNNSHQFDEHLLRLHRDKIWGLPPGGSATKAVDSPQTVTLNKELQSGLSRIWDETIKRELGFENYIDYRTSLPNPLNVSR